MLLWDDIIVFHKIYNYMGGQLSKVQNDMIAVITHDRLCAVLYAGKASADIFEKTNLRPLNQVKLETPCSLDVDHAHTSLRGGCTMLCDDGDRCGLICVQNRVNIINQQLYERILK